MMLPQEPRAPNYPCSWSAHPEFFAAPAFAPGATHEQMKLLLCTWAAQSLLEHARRQLMGRVLYEVVAAGPARDYVQIPGLSPVWAGSEAKRWFDLFSLDASAAEASDVETPPAKRRRVNVDLDVGGGEQTSTTASNASPRSEPCQFMPQRLD